jgi:hypothetical protein
MGAEFGTISSPCPQITEWTTLLEYWMRYLAIGCVVLGLFVTGHANVNADFINLSPSQFANVGTEPTGPTPGGIGTGALVMPGAQNIGLLQFDLSGVKTTVVAATLNLYGDSFPGSGPETFNIFRNTSSWNESAFGATSRPMIQHPCRPCFFLAEPDIRLQM